MDFYGTIGPACADENTLEEMLRLGMTGIRLNLSHVRLQAAGPQLAMLRRAAQRAGVDCRLLIDMQGPELRVGALGEPVVLAEGNYVMIGGEGIPVPPLVVPHLLPGRELLLDDGKLLLKVTEKHENGCTAAVLRGGILHSGKSIALPGCVIDSPAMTAQDIESVGIAKEYGVTGVMQPFVRGSRDLIELRTALNSAGAGDIRIFAKIENLEGVKNLPELLPYCDEVVIARGDLGNAVELWQLPGLQKHIAKLCRESGKPFMTVTQMLASMEKSPVPTRAEVSDIFNAVLDGSSSLMVTGETAVGAYPRDVIRYLVNTANEALAYMKEHNNRVGD